MRLKAPLYIAVAVPIGALGAAFGAAWWHAASGNSSAAIVATPMIGGPFALTAADGSTVTDRTYLGKIMLIYFGYTNCPDACPTTLNSMAEALHELGPLADRVQALFITVDPKRDTREVLASYVKLFDPRIAGLTGTPEQIAAAAKAYGVYYAPFKSKDAPDGYFMDHTSVVFVMNEHGRFVATFTQETEAKDMAERLRKLIGGEHLARRLGVESAGTIDAITAENVRAIRRAQRPA